MGTLPNLDSKSKINVWKTIEVFIFQRYKKILKFTKTRRGSISKLIVQGQHYVIIKPDKDTIRKLWTNVPNEHRCKIPQF